MTSSEKVLWEKLRKRRFLGFRFNRQYPISYRLLDSTENWFIADFYCNELKLIIEVDGPIHISQKEYDKERDETLKSMVYNIFHITNNEVHNHWKEKSIKLEQLIKSISGSISLPFEGKG